ncbi:MAG TPA: hypothetical protein VJ248_05825, partial [Candidatus Udaeobacter sp.]|nr:hypothetical protein [Candidatus Udaeobacter sp.]
ATEPVTVTGAIITTTTEEGAAASYQPGKTLVVREDGSNNSGRYVLNGPGHVVNKAGEIVQTAIKPGARVLIYYVNTGDSRVVGSRSRYRLNPHEMGYRKNHVMTKYTSTLVQSGLLAELLRRERRKMVELAWRRAHRRRVCAVFRSALTWPWRAHTAPRLVADSAKSLVGTVAHHT